MTHDACERPGQARLEALPALGNFSALVKRRVTDDPASFWHAECAFRELVATPTFVKDLIRYELARLKADPSYVAEESTESRITLLVQGKVELGLVHVRQGAEAPASALGMIGDHVMIGVLGPGSLSFEVLRHSQTIATDLFDPSARLDVSEEVLLSPGQARAFRAGAETIIERGSAGAGCMLLFVYRGATPIRWIYDPATRLPTRAVATDQHTYRMDFAARMLARMGYAPAASTLEDLFEHPTHFLRWAAARELMLLDARRGIELVERATQDAHPHVREAARRTLDNIRRARCERPRVTQPVPT